MPRWLRYAWAFPLTMFGVVPAILVWTFRGRAQVCDGALEVHGPLANAILRLPMFQFAAVTIGHIIIARDARCCESTRAHEHTHVKQSERWGPLFPFAYCANGVWQMLNGRRFYWDNAFEVAARNVVTGPNKLS
jgi:hypothetical protein